MLENNEENAFMQNISNHKLNDTVLPPTQPCYVYLPNYHYCFTVGEKALNFLQGQLTCDVNGLSAPQGVIGAYLNVKGRIITSLRVCLFNQQILLQIPSNIAAPVINKLNRIAMLSRVKLQVATEPMVCVAALGPQVFTHLACPSLAESPNACVSLPDLTLMRVGDTEGALLIGSATAVSQYCQAHPAPLASLNTWQHHLVQAGIVEIDQATTELFTPHEINLPSQGGVSFTKGCYVGQEIVARMQYLGKLKTHLQRHTLESSSSLTVGSPLVNEAGTTVGHIAAAASLAPNQYEILAVIRDDAVNFHPAQG